MAKSDIGISGDAVRRATGRSWTEWEEFLDGEGAEGRSHKEIVKLVKTKGNVNSGSWQQSVTVGYEKLRDERIVGETQAGLFQIGVQRTLEIPYEEAWRLLTSQPGTKAWPGEGTRLEFVEGETYRLNDGSEGEVRAVRAEQHLRITWQPDGWPRSSTIQVRVIPKDGRTTISFHQEHIPGSDEREERRRHFKRALAALQGLAKQD